MPPPTPRARALAALLVLLATLSLATGCSRVRAALAVQPDDTVKGEIVIAAPGQTPPVVRVPPNLDVEVESYREGGYTGSRLTFSGLDFADVGSLTSVAASEGRVKFGLRRVGNRVLAEGTADLATVSADQADFQLKITFPGEVLETNGTTEGRTVTWVFQPGEKGEARAVAGFADPNGPSAPLWTLLLAALVAAVCAAVVWLARRDRNPPVERSRR